MLNLSARHCEVSRRPYAVVGTYAGLLCSVPGRHRLRGVEPQAAFRPLFLVEQRTCKHQPPPQAEPERARHQDAAAAAAATHTIPDTHAAAA